MRILCLLSVCLAFTGCAALKNNVAFSEPLSGEKARIRVVIPDESPLLPYRGVRAYPNSTCRSTQVPGNGVVVNSRLGFEKTLNDKRIGIPGTPVAAADDNLSAEIHIAANQPVTFWHMRARTGGTTYNGFSNYDDGKSCSNILSFIPEANADYELAFGQGSGLCPVSLKKLAQERILIAPINIQTTPAADCKKPTTKKETVPLDNSQAHN